MPENEKRLPQRKDDCATVIRVGNNCYQCNKQLDWRAFPSDTSWNDVESSYTSCFPCLYNSVKYVRCGGTSIIYMPIREDLGDISEYPKSIKTNNGNSFQQPYCYERVNFSYNEPDNTDTWVYYNTVLQLDSCEECLKYTSKIKYDECESDGPYLNITLTWSGGPDYRHFHGACFTSGQTRKIAPINYICLHGIKYTSTYPWPPYTYIYTIPDVERWYGINSEIIMRAGSNYGIFNMAFFSGTFLGSLNMGNYKTAGTNINSNNVVSKWITPGAIVPSAPIRDNMKTGSVTFTNGVTISWTPFDDDEWNICGI